MVETKNKRHLMIQFRNYGLFNKIKCFHFLIQPFLAGAEICKNVGVFFGVSEYVQEKIHLRLTDL